jgi:endoglucanase
MSTTRSSQTLRLSSSAVRTAVFAMSLGLATACGGAAKPAATTPSGASEPSDNTPLTDPPKPPKATGNPLKGVKLWVDPESLAQARANALRPTEPAKAALLDKIAKQPQAMWLGEWNSDVFRKVQYVTNMAAKDGALPIFVAYNVPGRDCGQHSAGGLKTADMYRRWIRKVAAGIGENGAVVVLEPDSLGLVDNCLTPEQVEERMFLLHDAIKVLRQNPKTIVYLDGLHSKWAEVDVIVDRLKKAGVEDAHGFSINTSNYRADDELIPYGKAVSEKLGGAHFVIDTSRNGAGPKDVEWCNPPGRKLGKPPTTETGSDVIDAFLWLKRPGESDGECNGGPRAGVFWDQQAFDMAQ